MGKMGESFSDPFVNAATGGTSSSSAGGTSTSTRTTLSSVAPEVRCGSSSNLMGATLSDNGYIIIGMFQDSTPVASLPAKFNANPPSSYQGGAGNTGGTGGVSSYAGGGGGGASSLLLL